MNESTFIKLETSPSPMELETSPPLNDHIEVPVPDLPPFPTDTTPRENEDASSSISSTSHKTPLVFTKKSRLRSKVWDHYTLDCSGPDRSAKCNYCYQRYKYVGSTSCLRKHLKKAHCNNLDEDDTNNNIMGIQIPKKPLIVLPIISTQSYMLNSSLDASQKLFKGRKRGAKNWTAREIHAMLDVINNQMSQGPISWEQVRNALHAWDSDYNRSAEVYKEKYHSLVIQSRSPLSDVRVCHERVNEIQSKLEQNERLLNRNENSVVNEPIYKRQCANGIGVGLEALAKSQLQMADTIANAITSLDRNRKIESEKEQGQEETQEEIKSQFITLRKEFDEFRTEMRQMVENLSNVVRCYVQPNAL